MRILFVSTNFPTDLRTKVHGVFQRMGIFIDAIKEIAEVDLLFYTPAGIDISSARASQMQDALARHWHANLRVFLCHRFDRDESESKWLRCGASAINFFQQPRSVQTSMPRQVQALENCLRFKPDAVIVHRLAAMCPLMLTRANLPPIFFDLDDIEHIAYMRGIDRQYKWKTKIRAYLEVPALLWGERRAVRLAQQTFVCSELDRKYLATRCLLPRVVTIPNAVQVQDLLPVTHDPTMLFLGTYEYKPNIEAVEFLLTHVWPQIYRAKPDARLIIAGTSPENIRGFGSGTPGVEFTGFIDDLDQLYRRARMVVCPIFTGGGTRIKLLEAAAYGKPIVTTRIGAEGIEMHDNCQLFLRDNPESFAASCLELLVNTSLCERLGSAARATVVERYDRAKIVRRIQKQLRKTTDAADSISSALGAQHAN